MSKNLTRKGLAIGASSAVVLASLVGFAAPAQAATTVTIDTKFGSGFSVPADRGFAFVSNITDTAPANTALKWKIVDASAGLKTNATGGNAGKVKGLDDADATAASTAPADAGATEVLATAVPADGVSIFAASGSAANTDYSLKLFPAADANFSITAQAWLDRTAAGTVGEVDGTELFSSTITITFVKTTDITWSVNFTQPVLGDAKLKAVVSTSPALNLAQVQGSVGVKFTKGGAAATAAAAAPWDVAALSSGAYVANPSASAAVAADSVYAAQAYYGALVGSGVSYLTPAAKVHSVGDAATDDSVNFKTAVNAVAVRVGTATVPVKVAVKKSATDAAGAGIPIEITVTATALASGSSFTAGGKTISSTSATNDANKSVFTVNTDADGNAVFNVSAVGAKATDAFTVTAKAENAASANTKTYTYAPAAVGAAGVVNTNLLGGSAVLKAAKGSNYTLTFTVKDQFGFATPLSDLRVKVVQSVAANNSQTRYGDVVNGLASVTLPVSADSTDGTTITNTVTLENLVNGAWVTNSAAVTNATSTNTPGTLIGTSNAAATVTITGNTSAEADGTGKVEGSRFALNLKDLANADTRFGAATPAANAGVTLGGQVNDSLAQGTHASVTLSGTGLMFEHSGKFSVGSITVQTNASGAYAGVVVYSNKAGLNVVTATSGSATVSSNLYFKKAAGTTGATLTITSPDSVLPGSTFAPSVTLVDKYGNPVEVGGAATFKFSAVSPGFQVGSDPTTTSADGVAKLAYFLGNNDSGSIVLTATYDSDGNGATAAITATKTVRIGAASAVAGTSVKRTGNTVAVKVTGANVRIVLNGVRVASRSTAGVLSRTLTLRAGRNVIQLVVGGEVVRTVRYTR
jgi:hypothetical protein